MKLKKICALATLVSCASLAACSSAVRTSFDAYWRKSLDSNEDVVLQGAEAAEYDVIFEAGDNASYSVKYTDGKYTTRLSGKDKNYLYETHLTIDVQYFYGDEASEVFTDEVVSSVVFKSTQKGLSPVRSEKKSVMHSPITASPVSLNTCYSTFYSSVVTDYETEQCTISSYENASFLTDDEAKATLSETRSITVEDDYSLIDNESLLVAIRGVSSSTTETVFVYNSAAGALQKVQFAQEAKTSADFEFIVTGKDTEKTKRTVAYTPFTVSINETNSGSSQKVWVATDRETNEYRNIVLRMDVPLSFNLGTLSYRLNTVDFLKD